MASKRCLLLILAAATVAFLTVHGRAQAPQPGELRQRAEKLMNDGNWKEAYDIFRALALDKNVAVERGASNLTNAVECLRRLNRVNEFDDFIERAIEVHSDESHVL